MKYVISLLLMILFHGCVSSISKESAVASNFMSNFAKRQQCEKGFSVAGMGHSLPEGKIKKLTLYLVAERKPRIEEARTLYVNVTQQMLEEVNADEELRFCLDHYPFNMKDLHVSLAFKDQSGRYVDPPSIAFVFMANGVIHYASYDACNDLFFKQTITEPYSDALRKIDKRT